MSRLTDGHIFTACCYAYRGLNTPCCRKMSTRQSVRKLVRSPACGDFVLY